MMNNALKIIVTSNLTKLNLVKKHQMPAEKIEVVYPSFTPSEINIKEARKDFFNQLKMDKKTKIIFFTAKNLKNNGVKEFIDIILSLSATNVKVIIAGERNQITNLKFQTSKYNFGDKVLLYEDFENEDLLFAISDIFILPTTVASFSLNILKAMYYKTAVFITADNASREIVDVFATMDGPNDRSMPFKVDALLQGNDDLKLIKKQNRKTAKKLSMQNQLKQLERIVKRLKES